MSDTVEWGVDRGNGNVRVVTRDAAREAGTTPENLARDRADSNGGVVVKRVRTITTTEWESA